MHPFDILNLDNGARLIFTPCPGTKEASLQASLKTLKEAGAEAVVTMMPDAELSEFKADSLPAECEALDLAWFQLPVEDDCAPETPFAEAFANHKADLLARLAAGQTLAIHCRGGSGRTGLMAAILLLEAGYAPTQVKSLVQGLRPKALTLDPHVNYLNKHYSFAG
ncbi:tyrosine-protein phosphatase [Aeromonas hydrophila]|uniref:phosphatase domain-containing protein n=1 Tax=Aeromonas hydrophila TaxID=644 RepID=UPI003019AB9A